MLEAKCENCGKTLKIEMEDKAEASKMLYNKGWSFAYNTSKAPKKNTAGLLCPDCSGTQNESDNDNKSE